MAQITFLATNQDCETIWNIILIEMGLMAAATGERAIAMRNALEMHQEGVILRAGEIIYSPITSSHRNRRCT